jgi:two-component sensor histidine kinase
VLGRSFNFLMAPCADPEALAEIEAAFEGADSDPEIRYRHKDGSVFWASIYISPVRDEGGDVVQHFASFVDLTKHKQEKDRLRFLLDELNHRTQNTLATVHAIAAQTLRGVADTEVVDAFEGRILALSKAHTLLGRENWERGGPARRDRSDIAAVWPQRPPDIAWQVKPIPQGDRMRLLWQESGGPPVTPPGRKGFGSRLIESGLAQELDGEVRLELAGVVCQIVMPVPQEGGWMAP